MATACDLARCPARADVDDWKTTEYRKGCRRTPCTRANTLAVKRRREGKRGAVVIQLGETEALAEALADRGGEADPADDAPFSGWDAFDVVAAVRADLAALTPTHPMHRALSAIAMSLANQLQLAAGAVTPSARGAAAQLQATLAELAPAKKEGEDLDAFLEDLLSEDDDDLAGQPAG